MKVPGVQGVTVDLKRERIVVKFDARKTHAPDLHDAILKSGYKPATRRGLAFYRLFNPARFTTAPPRPE